MRRSGFPNCLWPRGSLTFDLLTPKLIVSTPLCRFASKSIRSFSKYRVHKVTDERTDGQTDGQLENIMPLPASLAWRRLNVLRSYAIRDVQE